MRLAKATKFHRKSGEALKALEKGRLQPMYAKVREHGDPSRGKGLVVNRKSGGGNDSQPPGTELTAD